MSRRLVSLLAAVLLLLGVVPVASAVLPSGGSFVDDNGSPYEPDIEALAAAGITKGCNPPANDRFCPDDPVTRGQMAAFLVRALHLSASGGSSFVDSGGVFDGDIDRLATAGITKGCNPPANDRFCPDDPVTRGQMAAFLVRALHLSASGGSSFVDSGGVFDGDIDRLATAGITKGCNPPANDRFCPDNLIARAQMATFLRRGLHLDPITPPPPELPAPGNPNGHAAIPAGAGPEDASSPDIVIGTGSPSSCTSQAVVDAVAQGGVIAFDCGPNPTTIHMSQTARVFNDKPDIVIDGGGLVTLSGDGRRRILYMNTCDPSLVWTTSHCQDQAHPRLTVQNLTFIDGDSSAETQYDGGGAIWVRGGRFKIVNSRFFSNRCASTGPDVGGGAVRAFDQHNDLPIYVVGSTFGGRPDLANVCSNGGALSSIGVSWTVINSLFTDNLAIGLGANPARSGTLGGGSGGRDLQRREHLHPPGAGHPHREQSCEGRRRSDLLCQQRSLW